MVNAHPPDPLRSGPFFHGIFTPNDTPSHLTLKSYDPKSAPSMKRVFFLNRYFSPDHSATSQVLSQLAFHLAETGTDVHVITSQQLYGDPQARLPPEENVRGVRVHRVSTTHFGRAALLGRGIDYLSFYTAAWRSLLMLADRGDIFVPMTDPPLLSIVAMRAARRRGRIW